MKKIIGDNPQGTTNSEHYSAEEGSSEAEERIQTARETESRSIVRPNEAHDFQIQPARPRKPIKKHPWALLELLDPLILFESITHNNSI